MHWIASTLSGARGSAAVSGAADGTATLVPAAALPSDAGEAADESIAADEAKMAPARLVSHP